MNMVQKELHRIKGNLQCGKCRSRDLETKIGFDGKTTHEYEIWIECNDCGTLSSVARLKSDHPDVIECKRFVNAIPGGCHGNT